MFINCRVLWLYSQTFHKLVHRLDWVPMILMDWVVGEWMKMRYARCFQFQTLVITCQRTWHNTPGYRNQDVSVSVVPSYTFTPHAFPSRRRVSRLGVLQHTRRSRPTAWPYIYPEVSVSKLVHMWDTLSQVLIEHEIKIHYYNCNLKRMAAWDV